MAGSADKRLAIIEETAEHIENDPRVQQLRDQLNNDEVLDPADHPQFTEVMPDKPDVDLDIVIPTEKGTPLFADGTARDFARDVLNIDPTDPDGDFGDLKVFDGAVQIRGHRSVTFEQQEALEGQELPEGYQPPENIIPMRNYVQTYVAENMLDRLSSSQVSVLGDEVVRGYDMDEASRSDWKRGIENGKKLEKISLAVDGANQASKPKTPVLQVAAQQFEARLTPIMVSVQGPLVKMRPQGMAEVEPQMPSLPEGAPMTPQHDAQVDAVKKHKDKAGRAERVSTYLSYLLLREKQSTWVSDTRKMIMKLAREGTMFRKVMYSAELGRCTSRVISGIDVVFQADAASMYEAPRITHRYKLQANQVISKIRAKVWAEVTQQIGLVLDGSVEDRSSEKLEFLECHMRYDLDGDSYPEPIIVTVHRDTGTVVRVEKNFDDEDVHAHGNQIVHIDARQCFVMYSFLPDPDGTCYGVGLYHTMAGQIDTINTLTKQITDAAILGNSMGGVIGKRVRFGRGEQGDKLRVQMNRFNTINGDVDDVRKQMMLFPRIQPSEVTFNLVNLFLQQSRDLAGVINPLSLEEIGANFSRMPVGTIQALMEQSLEVFSGIMTSVHHSMSQEFDLLYRVTGSVLDFDKYREVVGDEAKPQDFETGDHDIAPVNDPRSGTGIQKSLQAQKYRELFGDPRFNQNEVMRRYVEAEGFPNPHQLLASPDERQAAMAERREMIALRMAELELMEKEARVAELTSRSTLNEAKATKAMTDAESQVYHDQVLAPVQLEAEIKGQRDKLDVEVARSLGNDNRR